MMTKRIWLKVDDVGLQSFRYDGVNTVWASLSLGDALNIGGLSIEHYEKDDVLLQSWGWARARLLDVPLYHDRRKKNPLLGQVLAEAVYLIMQRNGEDIRAFLENKEEELELPRLKPESWRGLSLRIPVDFIKLSWFTSGPLTVLNPKVLAHVQIGHHLIFWSVEVFDGNKFCLKEGSIKDERLLEIIQGMLLNREFQRVVSAVPKTGAFNPKDEFIEAVPDCNINSVFPPSIRFY